MKVKGYKIKRYADLRSADLGFANLRSANLGSANLGSADLRSADLGSANLRSAAVKDVKWPAPTMVLLASWGECSDELTVDLMRYDASNHPEGSVAFDRWVETGACPFDNVDVERTATFTENKELWSSGYPPTAMELMTRLLLEHCETA